MNEGSRAAGRIVMQFNKMLPAAHYRDVTVE